MAITTINDLLEKTSSVHIEGIQTKLFKTVSGGFIVQAIKEKVVIVVYTGYVEKDAVEAFLKAESE